MLIDKIKANEQHNELETGVKTCVVTNMGRMAAHTGQEITYDQMLNCEHEFGVGVDKLTYAAPAPLMPQFDGRYPVPEPGIKKEREY